MTIVASNSLTISNVNDGSITHYAYAYSADGTDRFTITYPNLNLLSNTTFKNYTPLTNQYLSMAIKDGGVNNKPYVSVSYNNPTTNTYADTISWGFAKDYFKTSTAYTFSFYLRGNGTIRTHVYPSLIDTSSANGLADGKTITPNSDGSYDWNLTSEWVRHTYTFITKSSITTGQNFLFRIFTGNSADICLPKVEPGSIATPHMPSSTEVTTADWPSYIGQYSDFTSTASTDPTKYAPWTVFKGKDGATGPQGPQGLKGDPGATGIPGQAGADGKTSYLHIAYATNSTGTAGFDVSNATGKTYIGQYTDFTIADSTDPSKYTWSLIKGDKGDKGDQGDQGPAGSNGDPGKVVSDTEPTIKFKGLTWKYIGVTAFNASDGTNIQPNTEYYWNDSNWVINLINAQNINVDTLTALTANLGDATAGSITLEKGSYNGTSIKDGLVKTWGISVLSDSNYPDGNSYTSMGTALDSGGISYYSATYGKTLTGDGVIDDTYKVATLRTVAHNDRQNVNVGLVLNIINENYPLTVTGNTTINGDLTVTGSVKRSDKKVLLSGAYWMQAGQVVTPSKAISDCENGWILHFTSYTSGMTGETKNGNNHYFCVPKEQVNIADVGTMFPLVVQDGTMTLKYLYLQNNKITGNAANESTNSKKYVLQHVLEY